MPRALELDAHSQRLALYRQGLDDAEIAVALGLTPGGIKSWRRRYGLRRRRRVRAAAAAQKHLYRELYDLGLNDVQIARACGRHPKTVRYWRLGEGLPPQGAAASRRRPRRAEPDGIRMDLVLDAQDCELVTAFLMDLLRMHDVARACGLKLDVMTFMEAWRELPGGCRMSPARRLEASHGL